jgi:hypothetical protein
VRKQAAAASRISVGTAAARLARTSLVTPKVSLATELTWAFSAEREFGEIAVGEASLRAADAGKSEPTADASDGDAAALSGDAGGEEDSEEAEGAPEMGYQRWRCSEMAVSMTDGRIDGRTSCESDAAGLLSAWPRCRAEWAECAREAA